MLVISDKTSEAVDTICFGLSSPLSLVLRLATSISRSGLTLTSESTNTRYPLSVGTRPAEVWGEAISPMSSKSARTFLIVAGLSSRPEERASIVDPTGCPFSMYFSISDFRSICARSLSKLGSFLAFVSRGIRLCLCQTWFDFSTLRPRVLPRDAINSHLSCQGWHRLS